VATYTAPDYSNCGFPTCYAAPEVLQCNLFGGGAGCGAWPVCGAPPVGWDTCHDVAGFCYGLGDRIYCNNAGGPVTPPSSNPWWFQTADCDCYPGLGYLCLCPACCPLCATGSFEEASGLCEEGAWDCDDCPEGTVCDEGCERCVSIEPPQPCWEWNPDTCQWEDPRDNPPCPGVLTGCVFDEETCSWTCDPPPCDPDECWSEETCSCVATCVPGQCCCVATGRCINCNEPPCSTELNCLWNSVSCVWACDLPTCPPGEAYEYSLCACRPECPEGEHWCELTLTCVAMGDPDCKEELDCEWSAALCAWVCDNPETKCGPNREWLGEPDCRCEGSGGVWNLHTPIGHYHIADDLGGIRYRRAPDTVPPFTLDVAVTADTADRSPHMIRAWDGRIILVWVRGTDVLESVSDDEGETWQAEATVFTGATQCTIAKERQTGQILRAALVANEVVLTRQYPGDVAPSAEFPALVNPGATPLALDDAGFHLSWAPEGPGRWLLVGVDTGEVVNYASPDDGETWELL
jgi:hypothetical protein